MQVSSAEIDTCNNTYTRVSQFNGSYVCPPPPVHVRTNRDYDMKYMMRTQSYIM